MGGFYKQNMLARANKKTLTMNNHYSSQKADIITSIQADI